MTILKKIFQPNQANIHWGMAGGASFVTIPNTNLLELLLRHGGGKSFGGTLKPVLITFHDTAKA